MPIGVRDFLLVLRASDQASRVISQVGRNMGMLGQTSKLTGAQVSAAGSSLLGVGAAVGAVGAAGLAFFGAAAKEAKDYTQQVALTKTQIDDVNITMGVLSKIGKDVAQAIPAPFKEMQTSLYDIFSSIDVNAKQAQTLLTAFAKGAVAGQTDLQSASRATIGLLNAFKIPAEKVNDVMDLQFQVVRKGIVTYDEFAKTIGRSVPSAVKAGATMQDLGGMIAFLTRNNINAAMSSTSAARAFDLLSNPIFAKNMKEFGINVFDASGNFRPMLDVTTELRKRLEGLNEGEKAKVLKDLTFGAGGTIQAMRFLNLAVNDNNDLFGEMTRAMNEAGGASEAAYKIMAATPQAKIDTLKNKFDILQVTIGEKVLPHIGKLADALSRVIDWFSNLDPKVQDAIVKWGLIGAVVTVITGLVLAFVGVLLMLAGTVMTVFGVGFVAALGIMALVPIAIAAIIAIGYLLITHWEEVKTACQGLVDFLIAAWDGLVAAGKQIWENIRDVVAEVFERIVDLASQFAATLTKWWNDNGAKWIAKASEIWDSIVSNATEIWGMLVEAISHVLNVIMYIISGVLSVIGYLWREFGDNLMRIVSAVFNTILEVVRGVINAIAGVIKFVLAVINGDWGKAWDALKQTVDGVWDAIFGVIRGAAVIVGNLVGTVVEAILSPLRNLWDKMYGFGKNLIQGLIDGVSSMIKKVEEKVGKVVEAVTNPLKLFKFGSPSKFMFERGAWLGEGMANGMDKSAKMVADAAAYLAQQATPQLAGVGASSGVGAVGSNGLGFGAQASSTGSNFSLVLESGAIQISGAGDAQEVGAIVDQKLRALIAELKARGN